MTVRLGALADREQRYRLLRFIVVGLAGTLIYYVTALLGASWGLTIEAAHWLGFAVSIVFSYLAQKAVTFRVKGEHRRSVSRFVIATAVIAGTQFLVILGLRLFLLDPAILFAISSAYYPVASFIIHSLWTFKRRPD